MMMKRQLTEKKVVSQFSDNYYHPTKKRLYQEDRMEF